MTPNNVLSFLIHTLVAQTGNRGAFIKTNARRLPLIFRPELCFVCVSLTNERASDQTNDEGQNGCNRRQVGQGNVIDNLCVIGISGWMWFFRLLPFPAAPCIKNRNRILPNRPIK